MLIINFILVIAGIFLLFKGADLMVNSAIYVAEKTGIPKFIIGATVVSLGTTMPEMTVNLISSFQNKHDVIIGNVIGSNITNILLIAGLAAIIKPIKVKKLVTSRDIPFAFASIIVLVLLIGDKVLSEASVNSLSRGDGLILLLMYGVFIYFVVFSHIEHRESVKSAAVEEKLLFKLAWAALGLILLITGGSLVVQNSVLIAEYIGLSEKFIGLTIIAIGTSLPEFVTVLVSVLKNQSDIGLGNIVGSNISNTLLILGMAAVINPIKQVPSARLEIFVMFLATIFLIASLFLGKRYKIERAEGAFFLLTFLLYGVYLFINP